MPKVYKNRKKHIDPRYFLDETVNRGEEELNKINNNDVTSHVITEQSKLPAAEPDDDGPPPVPTAGENLDDYDHALLKWILDDLRTPSGHGEFAALVDRSEIAGQFATLMKKLGIDLKGKTQSQYSSEEQDKIRSSIMGSMAKNPPSTPWSKGR